MIPLPLTLQTDAVGKKLKKQAVCEGEISWLPFDISIH
jgi:hypothetical protein